MMYLKTRCGIFLAIAFLGFTVSARAGRIDAGTVEAGVSLELDFEGANGTTLAGDCLGGYFVTDGVLAGAGIRFSTDDVWSSLAFHGLVEQHFETDTPWIPYVGASLGLHYYSYDHQQNEVKASESGTALVLGIKGGVKFYLTEMAALDLSMNIALASEDVYMADRKPDNVDLALRLGLRFFLR